MFSHRPLENDVLYPCFLVVDSFALVVRAESQVGVHAEFQLYISPGMDPQPLVKSGVAIGTQMYAAKQARNDETRRKKNESAQLSAVAFWFVARQLCGHHQNIYWQIEI